MSDTISPPPPTIPSLAVGDMDWRYLDWTAELGPLGDSVDQVVAIEFFHLDGTPLDAGDIALGTGVQPLLSAGNQRVSFWSIAGTNPQDYEVSITVTTTQGRTLTRSAYLSVVDALG